MSELQDLCNRSRSVFYQSMKYFPRVPVFSVGVLLEGIGDMMRDEGGSPQTVVSVHLTTW